MGAHARYSPSAADRWTRCPGSVRACAGLPDTGSDAAHMGTMLHAVCENALRTDAAAEFYTGHRLRQYNPEIPVGHENDRDFDEDDAALVAPCLGYVRARCKELGVRPLREHSVKATEECWGTADVLLVQPGGALEVIDFKFGWNRVEAAGNRQLTIYLIGSLKASEHKHTAVRGTILQPRVSSAPLIWDPTPEEVGKWGPWLAESLAAAKAPDAPLTPGEVQCRYCPAASSCPALRAKMKEEALVDFDSVPGDGQAPGLPAVDTLDNARLGRVLAYADVAEGFLTRCREVATARALAGQEIPGQKLVAARTHRRWIDPARADKALGRLGLKLKDRTERKLKSIAKVEKSAPFQAVPVAKAEAFLRAHAEKPPGGPVLAPLDDAREAYARPAATQEFDAALVTPPLFPPPPSLPAPVGPEAAPTQIDLGFLG